MSFHLGRQLKRLSVVPNQVVKGQNRMPKKNKKQNQDPVQQQQQQQQLAGVIRPHQVLQTRPQQQHHPQQHQQQHHQQQQQLSKKQQKRNQKHRQFMNDQEQDEQQQHNNDPDQLTLRGGYILIDGSTLEGGGQLMRNCTVLSALLKKPIRITNIRANRSSPGLKPQHKAGFDLLSYLYHAHITGNQVNSTTVSFSPKYFQIKQQPIEVDPKTAGSVTLLFQISLPILVFTPQRQIQLILKGGTDVNFAPPIDFVRWVLRPTLEKFGIHFDIKVDKRGFYPKGGGSVEFTIEQVETSLKPINLTDPGVVTHIKAYVFICGPRIPITVAERMCQSSKNTLQKFCDLNSIKYETEIEHRPKAEIEGCGIIIFSTSSTGCMLSGSAAGVIGVPAEQVGEEAATNLIHQLKTNACVDEYLQDQIILFMALAEGTSRVKIGPPTLHTKTSIYFAELLSNSKFLMHPLNTESHIIGEESYILECHGIGYQNPFQTNSTTTTTTTTTTNTTSTSDTTITPSTMTTSTTNNQQ